MIRFAIALCATFIGFPVLACGFDSCGGSFGSSSSAFVTSSESFGASNSNGSWAATSSGGFATTDHGVSITMGGSGFAYGCAGDSCAAVAAAPTTVAEVAETYPEILSYEDGWRHAAGEDGWHQTDEVADNPANEGLGIQDEFWKLLKLMVSMLFGIFLLGTILSLVDFTPKPAQPSASTKRVAPARPKREAVAHCGYCSTRHNPDEDCRNCGAPLMT